jgi:hypothetical protein
MMSENLERARFFHRKIGEILLREWDPIGVQDIPDAQDEYDAYVSSIYKLLVSGKPEHKLFDYLWWIETEHMGLTGDRQQKMAIAKKLHELIA